MRLVTIKWIDLEAAPDAQAVMRFAPSDDVRSECTPYLSMFRRYISFRNDGVDAP